jgi:hypothetical protein
MVYGRAARQSEEQGYFLYPFYASFIYAPFSLIGNYILARALWMTVLELSLIGVLLISLSLCRWRPPAWIFILLVAFTLIWYHSVIAILDSHMLILCTLFLTLALLAIRAEHDVMGGFFISLTSVRPEASVLLMVFVLLWAMSQQRWLLFWSIFASLGFMVAVTSLFIPDWMVQNFLQAYRYYTQTFSSTPGGLLTYWLPGVGRQLGWLLTLVLAGMLVWEWRVALRQGFRWFLWTTYLTLAATQLIGIRTSLESFIVLLPAFVLILGTWDQRWGKLGRWLVLLSIIALLVAGWGLSVIGARKGIPPALDPVLFLFTPIFIILGLYWVRWWAIHSPQLPLEMFGRRLRGGMDLP